MTETGINRTPMNTRGNNCGCLFATTRFPFETITTASAREAYMLDLLKYFDVLPRPIVLDFDAQSATASWWAIPGKRYRLQYKTNLASGVWTSIAGDVIPTGHIAIKIDSNATPGQRFYSVVMLEP